jgi:hypothetical protein
MPRPRCGNDPRAQLTDADRQAIADFRAYLTRRAQEKTMAEQPAPKPLLTLATPCAVCTHPYNWHQGGICQAGPEENRCGCIAFAPAEQDEAQP